MALKLMKGSLQYKNQIIEMIKEWKSYNDTHDANTSPWAIFKNDYDDFEYYLNNLEISTADDGFVPDSTFFCLDEDRDTMVGAVNIRHYLNEYLLKYGGHIPSHHSLFSFPIFRKMQWHFHLQPNIPQYHSCHLLKNVLS